MNYAQDDPLHKSESPEHGRAAVEPLIVLAPPSHSSPSLGSNSTRTHPSTPETTRTKPAISRPQPPRRHTDKPTLRRPPSIQFPPPFTQKSSLLDQPGLSPISDPYTERSYLFQSLQGQNERAKKLLQRLSSAEERLLLGCLAAGEARRLRKEMRLLKKKMADNAQQERLTLLRLGDLYVDIQNRERWVQLQQQRLATVMAQQQQQPYYPRVFAPVASRRPEDVMTSTSLDTVPQEPGQMSPPPPPPPTAVPWFGSLPPLSPCTLSPLSPTFVPGLPFEANGFWASELKSCLGKYGDGNTSSAQDEEDIDERGRGHTPSTAAPSRASSLPRLSVFERERNRRASVPTVRMGWVDDTAAEDISMKD
ncbi:hypothetical protein CONLIGDRAFT_253014 [Coniochaeta ligniaria NRRL 30616]|uniref:Uncharacterized protein n=1 Tax=Coniochaeta ligniaria NRRL 30616 TaxID=1408157 RepID=A0A1J7IXA2_9PEZI|nr:hypothetical protein CONLIGDRAFT_253014 [Coniochaeta ligniaria NRRL 30616]